MNKSDQSFLFIPDITGFTEFVSETEIQHGQHIISELLEIIIDSNPLKLKISEVEGDAVLFYAHQEIPAAEEIWRQTEAIFINFHNHLKKYESERICQCGACVSTSKLSLKIIAHAGEIGFTSIKNTEKPYGADLVVIHKLLKNDIDYKEYLLISNELSKHWEENFSNRFPKYCNFKSGGTKYEKLGQINYDFFSLNPLLEFVKKPEGPVHPKLTSNPWSYEIKIDRPVYEVFETVINLDLRLKWNKGVNKLEYEEGKVNRIGTKHRCLFETGFADFETITNNFGEDKLVYGERLNRIAITKEVSVYYILNDDGAGTHLRLEIHIVPLPIVGWIMLPFLRYKISKSFKILADDLKLLCEQKLELFHKTLS